MSTSLIVKLLSGQVCVSACVKILLLFLETFASSKLQLGKSHFASDLSCNLQVSQAERSRRNGLGPYGQGLFPSDVKTRLTFTKCFAFIDPKVGESTKLIQ